jgi:hypothetical protein
MKLIVLYILYGAKVVLPNMGSGGDYEASRTVQSMASGWLMPYHKVGHADLEFSSRKSEAEVNLAN